MKKKDQGKKSPGNKSDDPPTDQGRTPPPRDHGKKSQVRRSSHEEVGPADQGPNGSREETPSPATHQSTEDDQRKTTTDHDEMKSDDPGKGRDN